MSLPKTKPTAFLAFLAAALAAPAAFAQAAQTPHPAVVRIFVPNSDGTTMGSGALVAVGARYGMVVTNWHVVREAAGPITVAFPDGFHSGASVLRVDQDWDLAALAIQRPQVRPIALAAAAPRPGEPLVIAGYGPEGVYRAVGGRCTKYYTPRPGLPREVVEVDVEARRGDSGGPIFNSRGEIAGILFGAGGNFLTGGYTMGSYCGRVQQFLAVAYVAFQQLPGGPGPQGEGTSLAQAPALLPSLPPPPGTRIASNVAQPPYPPAGQEPIAIRPSPRQENVVQSAPAPPSAQASTAASQPPGVFASTHPTAKSPTAQVEPASPKGFFDQVKNVLAVVGVIAVLFHGLRLVGSAVG